MGTRKPKRRYLFHNFLILCCLTLCLSACITGEITCDAYNGEGPIYVAIFNIVGEYIGGC